MASIIYLVFPTILCYIYFYNKMQADQVFQAIALYHVLRSSLFWDFTDAVYLLVEAVVSCSRVQVT